MSKCCAYHWSRSPAGIFFGYQRSTKPGSDQLAVPTRIFPVLILPEDLLVTHQRSHTLQRTQMGSLFRFTAVEQMLFRFAQCRYRNYSRDAGWSSLVARQAHNLKAAGSNPAPATKFLVANCSHVRPLGFSGNFCVRGSVCHRRRHRAKFPLRNRGERKSSVAQW